MSTPKGTPPFCNDFPSVRVTINGKQFLALLDYNTLLSLAGPAVADYLRLTCPETISMKYYVVLPLRGVVIPQTEAAQVTINFGGYSGDGEETPVFLTSQNLLYFFPNLSEHYHLILGCDFLHKYNIILNYRDKGWMLLEHPDMLYPFERVCICGNCFHPENFRSEQVFPACNIPALQEYQRRQIPPLTVSEQLGTSISPKPPATMYQHQQRAHGRPQLAQNVRGFPNSLQVPPMLRGQGFFHGNSPRNPHGFPPESSVLHPAIFGNMGHVNVRPEIPIGDQLLYPNFRFQMPPVVGDTPLIPIYTPNFQPTAPEVPQQHEPNLQ